MADITNFEQYSHRNGETEPPITDGWFWIRNPVTHCVRVEYVHWWVSNGGRYLYIEHDDGTESRLPDDFGEVYQWWGPVTPPWEDASV